MPSVYRQPSEQFPLSSFLRASGPHVGAAAAAAALRRDLVESKAVTGPEFDEAYAVARVTPGTNLLAMYVLLGRRLAGWRGAATALGVGAIVPAAIAATVAAAYVASAGRPVVTRAMQGARAGALAVLLWAAVRLLRPQLTEHRTRGAVLAIGPIALLFVRPVPQLVVLLLAGAAGAALLRRQP